MNIRDATHEDAVAISAMLRALAEAGLRTRPSDEAFVARDYIGNPNGLACLVAVEGEDVLGLQVLSRAVDGNEWGVPAGRGIIGTHVHPEAGRRGIGRALMSRSLEIAAEAGLTEIEASIGKDNALGLGFYEAMGFRTFAETESRVRKILTLPTGGVGGAG